MHKVADFWKLVEKTPAGCWVYKGHIQPQGYGQFYWHGRLVLAHRLAYEFSIGPIPEGLEADHTCHNNDLTCLGGWTCPHRRCVNVESHIELVTPEVNVQRAHNYQRRKTHCPQGHLYDEENTYRVAGERRCRTCIVVKRRRFYEQHGAEYWRRMKLRREAKEKRNHGH